MEDSKTKHVDKPSKEPVTNSVGGRSDTPLTDKEAESVAGGVGTEGVKKTMQTQV